VNQVFQLQKLERQTETLNFLVTINRLISYNIFFPLDIRLYQSHLSLHFTKLDQKCRLQNKKKKRGKKPTEENARRLSLNKIIKSFNKIEAIK
jgi:hypothetical protein